MKEVEVTQIKLSDMRDRINSYIEEFGDGIVECKEPISYTACEKTDGDYWAHLIMITNPSETLSKRDVDDLNKNAINYSLKHIDNEWYLSKKKEFINNHYN